MFPGSRPAAVQPVPASSPRPPRFHVGGRGPRREHGAAQRPACRAQRVLRRKMVLVSTREGTASQFSAPLPQPCSHEPLTVRSVCRSRGRRGGPPRACPQRPPCPVLTAAGFKPPVWGKSAYQNESGEWDGRRPVRSGFGSEARPPPCHRACCGPASPCLSVPLCEQPEHCSRRGTR